MTLHRLVLAMREELVAYRRSRPARDRALCLIDKDEHHARLSRLIDDIMRAIGTPARRDVAEARTGTVRSGSGLARRPVEQKPSVG